MSTPRWTDYLMLFGAAGHWPFGGMARNHWQLVHPERVLAFQETGPNRIVSRPSRISLPGVVELDRGEVVALLHGDTLP